MGESAESGRSMDSTRDEFGRIALHYAAADEDPGLVAQLLGRGQDPNDRDRDGHTPLHLAAQYDDAEVLGLLLDAGADIDARDSSGRTPLFTAVTSAWSSEQTVRLLRERGADPHKKSASGSSPFRYVRRVDGPQWLKDAFADLAD
ncbi:ankyrin repeat domain-containing protein [Nocardia sp. NPDC049220]|uniref:ankyrin repeat domain-containing protein n=1 Tax=Nocardia sp. NPDC049220 TaxID=3155273 RepID=UPI0034001D51